MARVMSGELKGFGAKVDRIVIDRAGKACTDGKTVWVPEHLDDDPRVNLIMQEAILAHEVAGHHRYTNFQSWNNNVVEPIKRGAEDPLLHKMTNMLEDARINHLLSQDFRGSGKRLDFTHKVFMKQHQAQTNDDSPVAQQAMVAMMTEAICHEPHWSNNQKVIDFMDENRSILFNAIKQPDTMAVIRQARRLVSAFRAAFSDDPEDINNSDFDGLSDDDLSHDDVSNAADQQGQQNSRAGEDGPETVSKARFQDLQEPEQPDRSETSEAGAGEDAEDDADSEGGEGASADGEDADGGLEEGEGSEPTDGDAGGDTTDGDAADGESTDGDSDSESNSNSDAGGDLDGSTDDDVNHDSTDSNSNGETGDFEESWADLLEQAESDLSETEYNALDMEADFHSDLDSATSSINEGTEMDSRYGDHEIEVTAGVRDLARRVENLDTYSREYDNVARAAGASIRQIRDEILRRLGGDEPTYQGGRRTGRVNNKQVYRVAHSDLRSDRVFKKKVNPEDVNANAIVLIDASGSMGSGAGSRAAYASQAAVVFSEVFHTLGFNYEVIDFNTGSGTTMRVRKGMGSDSPSRMEKAAICAPFSGYCNSDGYAVQWATDRLSSMDGNSLLIVISDGQPSGPSPSSLSSSQHLSQVTADAPKNVGLLGIGIAGCDTSAYYPNSVKVSDMRSIGKESLPTLRKMLRKIVPKRC